MVNRASKAYRSMPLGYQTRWNDKAGAPAGINVPLVVAWAVSPDPRWNSAFSNDRDWSIILAIRQSPSKPLTVLRVPLYNEGKKAAR